MDLNRRLQRIRNIQWIASSIGAVVVFILMSFFILGELNKGRVNEVTQLTKQYNAFESDVYHMLDDGFDILRGFQVLLEIVEIDESDQLIEDYMRHVISINKDVIRNVGIIKDTTIVWVYPYVYDDTAIQIDLLTVENQAAAVIEVKENRSMVFDGPVEVLQGGVAFIGRMPIIKKDGSYWGQISSIMYLEEIVNQLESFAIKNEMEIHIVNSVNGDMIVHNENVLDQDPILFKLKNDYSEWQVYATPLYGWDNRKTRVVVSELAAFLISIIVFVSIFQGFKVNERLTIIASKDSLTGLYNRYFFQDYRALIVSNANRYHKKVGLIVLDLNRFKEINDMYGHRVGDLVLKKTASILGDSTRNSEAVFRMGGDEFLIIVPELNSNEELEIVVKRIKEKFKKEIDILGHIMYIEPSIGFSIYTKGDKSFDDIIHEADMNMYKYKRKS